MFKSKNFIYLLLLIFTIIKLGYAQEDLDTAITKLTDQIIQHMTEKEKTRIAVIPFPNLNNEITTLGSFLAEELTTKLFNTSKFKIIERNLLNKVLDELKLSATGAIDSKSAKELGKIIGVDAIVTGTITDLGSRVAINCRLIETETGEIFAAASVKIFKDESVKKIMGEKIAESENRNKSKEIEADKNKLNEKTVSFDDKIFIIKPKYSECSFKIELTTINIIKDKKIIFNLLYKNESTENCRLRLNKYHGEETTYITDNFGERYFCLSTTTISDQWIEFPPQIPIKVTMTFPKIKEEVSEINFVSPHSYPNGKFNVIFSKIKILK